MITPLLQFALDPHITRRRTLHARLATAAAWGCAAALGVALWALGLPHRQTVAALLAAILAGWIFGRRRGRAWQPDYRAVAREIEERHPDLHALLRTAVEQQPAPGKARLGFLQERVIARAAEACRQRPEFQAIPARRWASALLAQAGALAACAAVFFLIWREPGEGVQNDAPLADGVAVSPGDAKLERGSGFVVLARFGRQVPTEAVLVVQPQNQPATRLPLVRNLADPVFGGGLPSVDAGFSYRVEYAGRKTRDFHVAVYENPRLERADATLRFPAYTHLPEKKIPDTRQVSAVEGSTLQTEFSLNKPVRAAELIGKDGTHVPLTVVSGQGRAVLKDFAIRSSQTYALRLEDADGRTNKLPASFVVQALPNRPPELKIVAPKGDRRFTPIEEVSMRGEAWDDFGLTRYGLSYTIAGQPPQDLELGRASGPDERRAFSYLLKLEELGVQADQLISWHLWAEDVDAAGQPRRTTSDLYFAEIRPFEEIYRQGQTPEGGQASGQASQAEKLSELQKQIIAATWKLQGAAEPAHKPGPKYSADEPVVRDSQAEALKQAQEMERKAENPRSQALAGDVVREMQAALNQLAAATETVEPLPAALTAEQGAYAALLKLAAHEFQVVQQSRSQRGQGGQQKNRQELDQLEMKEDRKRYETKREAEPQQEEQQREQLAVLSRLKELAQRQGDINERVKELQTALDAARTEAERQEAQRQLQRLREDQQQMLSDLDELRQKLEQSAQQSQYADERRRLDQARDDAQKTAEALASQEAGKAAAKGARAAQELQAMRDDFRKKTSGQFQDEMREMRRSARDLADREKEIAGQLSPSTPAPQRPSLDAGNDRSKLGAEFDRQKENLEKLSSEMKGVSEAAEAAEPLLAKELYDALRKNSQADTANTLAQAGQLAQRGIAQEAQKFEEKARQEIDELAAGVERAAEGVLGDEAEGLRRARAELDTLTQQLEREAAAAQPKLAKASSGTGKESGKAASEEPNAGEPRPPSSSAQAGAKESGASPGEKSQGDKTGSSSGKTPSNEGEPNSPGKSSSIAQAGKEGGQPGAGQGASGKSGETAGKSGTPGAAGNRSAKSGKGGGEARAPGEAAGAQAGDAATASAGQGGGGGGNGGAWLGQQPGADDRALTGEHFTAWSDRLRNVEEMVDDPALRNGLAGVREAAKGVRVEFKRNHVQPDWDLVRSKIVQPLAELRNRLSEELARRESRENLTPIDRDPVPAKYAERVRRYYEDLGRSR